MLESNRAVPLAQRVALVTGAGRGIGAATVRRLCAAGASVVASDLDAEPLAEVADSARELPGDVATFVGDVTADDFAERAVSLMLERFGGCDILVNNAGYIWNTTIQKTTDEQWQSMLDVHLTAPFRVLRAASAFLREAAKREAAAGAARHRKVVNVSSISGVQGAATQVAYSSAKAGVVGLTRTLAREWGRYRVNVNAVAYGYIETRLTQETPPEGTTVEVQGRDLRVGFPKAARDRLVQSIALGRAGTPEEAAGAIYLLCSPDADFITGQVLICDGGTT